MCSAPQSIGSDHLNSTSTIVNQAGVVQAQQYYIPFGGNRGGGFSTLTTKRYTGQYHEAGLPGGEGLYFYNARWYDAQLGRFTQADTIVPGPGKTGTPGGSPARSAGPEQVHVCAEQSAALW